MPATAAEDVRVLDVPLSEIVVVKDFNHRSSMDKDQLKELTESVKQFGVIEPIICFQNGSKKYQVVAGHRRFEAAKAAKLTSLKICVRPKVEAGDLEYLSLIENLLREDVRPVDQARAFAKMLEKEETNTHKKLASKLSISTSTIATRLQLLDLPESTQVNINDGTIPMRAVPLLAKVGKVSKLLAEGLSNVLLGKIEAKETIDDVLEFPLDYLCGDYGDDFPADAFAVDATGGFHTRNSIQHDPKLAELKDAAKDLRSVDVPESIIDAARAYGCLIELEDTYGHTNKIITDAAWFIEHMESELKAQVLKQSKADAKRQGLRRLPDGASGDEAAKKLKEKEKAKKEEAQRVAYSYNTSLGVKLRKTFTDSRKVSVEQARVLAAYVLSTSSDLALAGMVRCMEDWHVRETTKTGKTKFTWPDGEHAHDRLSKWIMEGKTADAVLNRLTMAMVAAKASDDNVPKAVSAYGRAFPSSCGAWNRKGSKEAEALLDKASAKLLSYAPQHPSKQAKPVRKPKPKPIKKPVPAKAAKK